MNKTMGTGPAVLLLVSVAVAFMPGPDIIRRCTGCGSGVTERTMLSGNTFGAKIWTDGKLAQEHSQSQRMADNPMHPSRGSAVS